MTELTLLPTSISDIEVANRHGHTCLMIACYKGHLKIAKYLIDAKADVNRKSVKGNTALHDCAESGSLEIMKLLLVNGAKIDVDAYGMTNLYFFKSKVCSGRFQPQKSIDEIYSLDTRFMATRYLVSWAHKIWTFSQFQHYQNNYFLYPNFILD